MFYIWASKFDTPDAGDIAQIQYCSLVPVMLWAVIVVHQCSGETPNATKNLAFML